MIFVIESWTSLKFKDFWWSAGFTNWTSTDLGSHSFFLPKIFSDGKSCFTLNTTSSDDRLSNRRSDKLHDILLASKGRCLSLHMVYEFLYTVFLWSGLRSRLVDYADLSPHQVISRIRLKSANVIANSKDATHSVIYRGESLFMNGTLTGTPAF